MRKGCEGVGERSDGQGSGVNNLRSSKSLTLHKEEQIIDIAWLLVSVKRKGGKSERGRCCMVNSYLPYAKTLRFPTENFGNDRMGVNIVQADNTDSP